MTDSSLATTLLERFALGVEVPMADAEFNALALAVFAHQYRGSAAYAGYCDNRRVTPDSIEDWEQVPAIPTRAFKVVDFNTHPAAQVQARFHTSGTSKGVGNRGAHMVADLTLYTASLLPNFQANLLPEGVRLPMFCLALPPTQAPESSLSHMLGVVEEALVEPQGYFVETNGTIDLQRLEDGLREYSASGDPVLIAGTAFTFVHWLDSLGSRGVRVELPEGSRIMETGGFKGRSREVARPELYAALEAQLGVRQDHIVNEYGMTELLSQYYEPVLRGLPRRHVPPPWMRTRILDPATLRPLAAGQPGLIQHFDLANLHSVSAVLTEDVGVLTPDGLEHLGRAGDAEPRGCSIAMDALLSSSGVIPS